MTEPTEADKAAAEAISVAVWRDHDRTEFGSYLWREERYLAIIAHALAPERQAAAELREENERLKGRNAKRGNQMIELNINQAKQLFNFFGCSDSDVSVQHLEAGHSGAGLYAYCTDYPDEGAIFLDPEDTEARIVVYDNTHFISVEDVIRQEPAS